MANKTLPETGARGTLNRPPGRPNSTQASSPSPAIDQGASQFRTEISTFITKIGPTQVLYGGSRIWAQITVTLETAGPACVGTKSNLTPVLSGKGILLETLVPKTFTIAKGDALYVAANSISRIKLEVQPVPWLEQLAGTLSGVGNAFSLLFQRLRGGK